jgi:heme oxygenase
MNELTVSKENQDAFLKNLRQETAESHKRLEDNFYSKTILEPSVQLIDYQTYIAKLYGIVAACENEVFPHLQQLLPDLDQRLKSQHIIDDLTSTGIAAQTIENLPVSSFKIHSTAQAMGMMYVVEGSTLGGMVLYKHISKVLGLSASSGASYFYGYGQQTGSMWKRFVSAMAAYAVEHNCEEEMISAATQTFTNIDLWLSQAEINWKE